MRPEHGPELFAIGVPAGDVFDVLVEELPAVGSAEVAQLGNLVLGILALSPGDAGVNGDATGTYLYSVSQTQRPLGYGKVKRPYSPNVRYGYWNEVAGTDQNRDSRVDFMVSTPVRMLLIL
jgi:hypothetical protein